MSIKSSARIVNPKPLAQQMPTNRPINSRPTMKRTESSLDAGLLDDVETRMTANQRVRRTLTDGGRLHIDRQLPFLCVYRAPSDREDIGTKALVQAEASYLIATESANPKQLAQLVTKIAEISSREFGAFLLIEVWAGSDEGKSTDHREIEVSPRFKVWAPPKQTLPKPTAELLEQLGRIKVLRQQVEVNLERDANFHAPGMRPLLTTKKRAELNCYCLGIEVPPVWRDIDRGHDFPLLMRTLVRRFSHAVRRSVFQFVKQHTTQTPKHFHELGRRAVVKAVWDVDKQLGEVSDTFEFLIQVTPINTFAAWQQFKASRYERPPQFHYLPTPMNPAHLKRELYRIPIERVEDPALHNVFRQKQEVLDRKITMLRDRNSRAFLYGSLQLFGDVDDDLHRLAIEILDITASGTNTKSNGKVINASEIAALALQHVEYYRKASPNFKGGVEVSPKPAGIMVSRGKLVINDRMTMSTGLVEATIHHEVGTHLVTYYNGMAQPFRQLGSGLANYEELQEGLAVLAEYLSGGLAKSRIRQLAARVIAVKMLVEGADFVQVYRTLVDDYDFAAKSSYTTTMRVFRGGGFTKDAVYLRGLQKLLNYLGQGGMIDPLLVGKMGFEQLSIIRELLLRKVIQPAVIIPRFLTVDGAAEKLNAIRSGISVADIARDTVMTTTKSKRPRKGANKSLDRTQK